MAQNLQRAERLEQVVHEALVSIVLGEPQTRRLQEGGISNDEKAEIERIVKRKLNNDLEAAVQKILKQELKSSTFEDTVTGVVSRALAKYHEILFTRKSSWQNQLKSR